MFLALLLLFTVIPALEIFLFIEIGGQIGAFNTFMIVIVTGIVGAALAKSQGLQIIQKIQTELNDGKLPADQFFHGLLVFGGGLLLLTPGFIRVQTSPLMTEVDAITLSSYRRDSLSYR